jgi:hypothetical protein
VTGGEGAGNVSRSCVERKSAVSDGVMAVLAAARLAPQRGSAGGRAGSRGPPWSRRSPVAEGEPLDRAASLGAVVAVDVPAELWGRRRAWGAADGQAPPSSISSGDSPGATSVVRGVGRRAKHGRTGCRGALGAAGEQAVRTAPSLSRRARWHRRHHAAHQGDAAGERPAAATQCDEPADLAYLTEGRFAHDADIDTAEVTTSEPWCDPVSRGTQPRKASGWMFSCSPSCRNDSCGDDSR